MLGVGFERIVHLACYKKNKHSTMKSIIFVTLCAVAAHAAKLGNSDAEATIVNYENEVNGDGTYNFAYETSNGIKHSESGKQIDIKDDEPGTQATGSFSYTSADGVKITLTYTADDNGFVASGDHLPTPPPLPEHVVELLARLAKN